METFKDYEEAIKDSLIKSLREKSAEYRDQYLIIGLHEESAEITAPIRKTEIGNYHFKEIDKEQIGEEIGDELYYIAQIAMQLPDCSLHDIAINNIKKLHEESEKPVDFNENITFREYMDAVLDTYKESLPEDGDERAIFLAFGLAAAEGRVTNAFWNQFNNKKQLNINEATDALGDILLHMSAIADTYGLDLAKIAEQNIKKIHSRYNIDGTIKNNIVEEGER